MAEAVEQADDLYGLDASEFVAARDALAKRLRQAGDKEEAARIKKLRRPTAAAAALNAVARREPEQIEEALAAGQRLREATEAAVSGDASDLRAATAAERQASEALLRAAGAEAGGTLRARMEATLRAAVVDDHVAERLRRGVLAEDHDVGAFGFAAAFDVDLAAPSSASSGAAEEREAERRRRREELESQLADAEAAAADRAARADEAEAAARSAREAAEAAARAVEQLRDELEAL